MPRPANLSTGAPSTSLRLDHWSGASHQGAGIGKDVLLITDGRFSGGSTGLCIGHVAPEAVDGGPIAFIHDGDPIKVDIPNRTIDILIDDDTLAARRTNWTPPHNPRLHGVLGKYAKLVHTAAHGAVLY